MAWYNKIILLLSSLASILFAGLVIAGSLTGELPGNVMFGLIVLACFADLIVPISYFSDGKLPAIVAGSWVALSMVVVALGFLLVSPAPDPRAIGELGMIIGYPMAILSIPSGPVFSALVDNSFPDLRPNGFYQGNIYDWFLFFLAGYLQWFIVFPAAIRVLARCWRKRVLRPTRPEDPGRTDRP